MARLITEKQKKLVKLATDNLRLKNKTLTKGEMMIQAGYSPQMSKKPAEAFNTQAVREQLQQTIALMQQKRLQALNHITNAKMQKSNIRDLAYTSDIMTKNSQLLSGGETERHGITVEISEIIAKKNGLTVQAKDITDEQK